jgi:hypothetical protein
MKRIIITAILCGMLGTVYAQQSKTDSISPKKHVRVKIGAESDTTDMASKINRLTKKISDKKAKHTSGFSFGLTFSNLHLGFATLLDNGSFTLSPKNNFLSYRQIKTSNVGFDLIKFGYRFNDNFKMSVAGGFDWTLIRLNKNETILGDGPALSYVTDNINYSKNRFSSNYLTIPLTFDLRTKEDKDGKRFHFAFGPEGGFLIDGMQKQISDEHGKTKNFNDFHFTRFEYGSFAKIGYGSWGIYTKYYFNDMFENSPDQKGLKSFDFGLTLGF